MDKRKYKLTYLITALNVGGAETMLYRMLGKINRSLFDVTVITLRDEGVIGDKISNDLGIEVLNLNLQMGIKRFFSMFVLGGALKKRKPDILHAHMFHANILARLMRLIVKIPVVICTIHNIDEKGRHKSATMRVWLYRFTDFLCDFVSHVSEDGKVKYLKIKAVSEKKFEYIPNGIDVTLPEVDQKDLNILKAELGAENYFILIAVGSLTKQKDYPNLLKAFAIVNSVRPETLLLIAGEGPLKRELKVMVQDAVFGEKVRFLGMRDDIFNLLRLADVFVLSSAWEGLPLVLLEAAICELPLVVTDVGDNREIVNNNKSGILVQPGDAEALARAMMEMIGMNTNDRKKMGREAKKIVSNNYSLDVITKRWENIYLNLAKEVNINA